MKYLVLSVALVFVYKTSTVNGQICKLCNEVNCTEAVCDHSGHTLDLCGCCTVCASQFNETCGGPWNTYGVCDKNLTCMPNYSDTSLTPTCSDNRCRSIVDFVFALDGSQSSRFDSVVIWTQEVISRIYDMYGACANVEVMQYAGTGGNKTQVYPVELGLCTNNNDCMERKLESFTHLNLPGKETFATLFSIVADRFPMSSRFDRSQKVIIVVTFGGTADVDSSERWLLTSSSDKIVTYATQLGTTLEELVNITGSRDRVIDPAAVDDFLNQLWKDTDNDLCPPGEEYFNCITAGCEPTCVNRNPGCDGTCITSGCACMKGYARHNGVCIPEEHCTIAGNCSYGEEFRNCSSVCTPTCDNPSPICPAVCGSPKCQCMSGYVRLNGSCVPEEMCPKGNCSYGEMFRNCSSICTPTCDNPYPTCPAVCGPPKCECMVGYVRHNGSCMPEDMCPKVECPLGEVYKKCSSLCEPTCAEPYPACIEICMPAKCQCMDGYVKESGECIPISKCHEQENCSTGEVFMNCSSRCTPTCNNFYPTCTQDCGPPKCQCMKGYVMHNGTCIPHGYCPSYVTCDYPKVRQDCASNCQATCDNPAPRDCNRGCSMDPCVCPADYVLFNETDRRCVHQYECPAKTCIQQCPTVKLGATAREASAVWVCQFKNWRCTSYQWKLSIEEWWDSSECYAVGGDVESRWRRLFECPEYVEITCNDASQYVNDVDAFGCEMGRCQDGGYRDGRQLMKLWMVHQMKYQEKLQLYQEATSMCQRSFNINC